MDVQKPMYVNYPNSPTGAEPFEKFFDRLFAFAGRSHRHSGIRRFARL